VLHECGWRKSGWRERHFVKDENWTGSGRRKAERENDKQTHARSAWLILRHHKRDTRGILSRQKGFPKEDETHMFFSELSSAPIQSCKPSLSFLFGRHKHNLIIYKLLSSPSI